MITEVVLISRQLQGETLNLVSLTNLFETLYPRLQIRQDNEDAQNGIEKSIATICEEEGISFEQVFYILFFNALAFRVENLF